MLLQYNYYFTNMICRCYFTRSLQTHNIILRVLPGWPTHEESGVEFTKNVCKSLYKLNIILTFLLGF